jgi:hypothetical protein
MGSRLTPNPQAFPESDAPEPLQIDEAESAGAQAVAGKISQVSLSCQPESEKVPASINGSSHK